MEQTFHRDGIFELNARVGKNIATSHAMNRFKVQGSKFLVSRFLFLVSGFLFQPRLEDATLVFIYKGHYQNGQLAAKVASSRRIVGEVRSAPAHPSLALSMYGVIEIASSRRR